MLSQPRWWSRLAQFIGRRSHDDFAAEVESHLALEVDRLVAEGMPIEDARHAARRAFGNTTGVREQFRESRRGHQFESLAQDVRYGLRAMRRAPGFTAVAVASLVIGIGANATMFGAIDALLIRTPLHIRDAERIHRVNFTLPTSQGSVAKISTHSYQTYLALRDGVAGLEAAGAYWPRRISSGRGADARPMEAVLVTPGVFAMLGVNPVVGRFFDASEERDDGTHVAVIGHDVWNSLYGSDSAVIGKTIDVAGLPYTIIGVAPRNFTGLDINRVDLWLPLGVATRVYDSSAFSDEYDNFWLSIVLKRRAGTSVAQLTGDVTKVYRHLKQGARKYEQTFAKSNAVLGPVVAARGPTPNADAKVSLWVAVVSLLVLLIACANVANLLLLRGLSRSRELALRLSLGATRGRLVRQSLVEGVLLAVIGGVGAILLARWSQSVLWTFLLPQATNDGVLAPRVLAFTTIIALGTGILASLIPALATARRDFGPIVGAGRVGGARSRLKVQRTLIGGQVALATLLLVGAGLFVVSLKNVHAIDLGLDAGQLLYVKLDLKQVRPAADNVGATQTGNAIYQAVVERVRQVPGVVSASLTVGEPLASGSATSLRRRGDPATPPPGVPLPWARAVGQDYFKTMGTALRRGRLFTAADHAPNAHVAIVDEATAKRVWPDGDPLDQCAYLDGNSTCTEIVGVVASTVLWQITGDQGSVIYLPLESRADEAVSMMEVRTSNNPAAQIEAVRQAVLSVKPDLAWVDIRPVSQRLDSQLRPWRLGASMFTAFGVLALGLAAVGLYGLLSYSVASRAHEIGVRKALGADDAGVVQLVIRGALGMTLPGVLVGVLTVLAGGRLIASQLYGIVPNDPVVIAGCAATLVVVAVVACFAPARRATKVDPMVTLRSE